MSVRPTVWFLWQGATYDERHRSVSVGCMGHLDHGVGEPTAKPNPKAATPTAQSVSESPLM